MAGPEPTHYQRQERANRSERKEYQALFDLDDIPKGRTNWKRVRALTDEEISEAIRKDPDAPPILDKEWFSKVRIVIPEKTSITIRLDRDIIEWFKKHGKGYQTRKPH